MITLGLRLRDFPSQRCSWRDLYVIIKHSRPDSHLYGVIFPDRAGWDLDAVLAGHTVDALRLLLWSKTKGARHGSGKPKTVLPFGKTRETRPRVKPAPLSEIKRRLDALHHRTPGARHRESPQERSQKIRDIFKD